MKVSNLYIGDIGVITKIKEVPLDGSFKNLFGAFIFETSITYRIKRHTILLKTSDKNEEVKDIIYGGKYKIKKAGDCEIGEEFHEKSGDVYSSYRAYCMRTGDFTRSTTEFYNAIEQRDFRREKRREGRFIIGLKLAEAESEF